MSLKDILIHTEATPAGIVLLKAAIALARRHGAHLKGVHSPERDSAGNRIPTDADRPGKFFAHQVAAAGITAEWLSDISGHLADTLVRHAHCADLVVVGQPGMPPGVEARSKLLQRLILEGGRPVLVIPYAGSFSGIGTRVLVALTGGKEATRASRTLHDALPLLRSAQQVTLVEVVPGASAATGGEDLCPDLPGHLDRHGVHPTIEKIPAGGIPVADALLNRAYEGAFDLLVMGANIHAPHPGIGSGLGPVTSQIIRQMTLPVLMAL